MKNNMSVNHHTIPQFYLNNFANKVKNGYDINVFNKNREIKYKELVKNVGFVKRFNTIEMDGHKTDIFEKMHNEVFEKYFSIRYPNIIRKVDLFNQRDVYCYNCLSLEYYETEASICIDYCDKSVLSYLLAYFIFRGRKIRYVEEGIYNSEEKILTEIYKSRGFADDEEIEKMIIKNIGRKEDVKLNQLVSLFKGEELHTLAELLYRHVWIIAYNNTNELLYTSDNGHALDQHRTIKTPIGYNTYGNIIIFPLSSRICVIMLDKEMYCNQYNDLSFLNLELKQVKAINDRIAFDGIDEIYSKDGDWRTLDAYYERCKIPKGHKPYKID